MSMLGVSYLNKIVNEQHITRPDEILNLLRENVIRALKQKGVSGESKDGMDISLLTFEKNKKTLHYAGANNPLYIVRKVNGEYEVIEKKADRMPVAIHYGMSDFQNQEFELQKNDTLYMFSDGYIDQFGGPEGRKFMNELLK